MSNSKLESSNCFFDAIEVPRSDHPAQFPDKRMTEKRSGNYHRVFKSKGEEATSEATLSFVALVGPFIISIFVASLSKGASRSPPPQQSFIEISAVPCCCCPQKKKEGVVARSDGRTVLGRELIKYYIVVDVQSCLGDLQETGGFL